MTGREGGVPGTDPKPKPEKDFPLQISLFPVLCAQGYANMHDYPHWEKSVAKGAL